MPKIKVPRKSTLMDMTAMCDVAFLLLTFFILTAKFRPEELVQIQTPSSRATQTAKDDLVTISVDTAGNAYFSISNKKRKADILDKMIAKFAAKYPGLATMTPKQKMLFLNLEEIGMPVENLPQVVLLSKEKLKSLKLTGIPKDSSNNQLADWIMATRYVYANDDVNKVFAIKGDKSSNIKAIKRVIDVLRENEINTFKLITSLEGNKD